MHDREAVDGAVRLIYMPITKRNILTAALILFAVAASGIAQKKALPVVKEGLINELRQPGFSPAAMVKFIKLHGVNFIVTPDLEAQLLSAGANAAIIQAAKENYRLPGGKRASFLNVAANVADAEFAVEGVGGTFTGMISDHPLAPGTYRITAKRTGYLPETQTAQIREPGKRVSVNFTLKPASLNTLVDEARAALDRKDYNSADVLSRQVLAREPLNAPANMLLGRSFYIKGDYAQAAGHVTKGLQGGESISFMVGHQKDGRSPSGETLEFGWLILKPSKIAFLNQKVGEAALVSTGGATEFDIPYAKIMSLETDKKNNVSRISMKASIPRTKGKDDKRDFNFYMSRSRVEMVSGKSSGSPTIVCGDCEKESQFITDLIGNMKRHVVQPQKKVQ